MGVVSLDVVLVALVTAVPLAVPVSLSLVKPLAVPVSLSLVTTEEPSE